MATTHDQNDIFAPLDGGNPRLADQPTRRWSISMLMAIRPIPNHHNRRYAEEWNHRYSDISQVQVDPARFPEAIQERSAQEIEENDRWLKDLGNGIQRPNPRFSGQ